MGIVITVNEEKLELLDEMQDSKYGDIKRCLYKDKIIYVINNKIVKEDNIITKLEIKYGFLISDEFKNIVF